MLPYVEHFWGPSHHGYHVLYEHYKQGEEATTELEQLVREGTAAQEDAGRALGKCAARVSSFTSSSNLAPAWLLTKGTIELMAEVQANQSRNLQELLKEVGRYRAELAHSRKRIKEGEIVDAVSLMQTTTTCLQKTKETYISRHVELEKLRGDTSASAKELSKAEQKLVRARDEYRGYVDKYEGVRVDFEEKMARTAETFQAHDRAHLSTLKNFLLAYAGHQQESAAAALQIASQLRESLSGIVVDDLLDGFVRARGTGTERPQQAIFDSLEAGGGGLGGGGGPSPSLAVSRGPSVGGGGGGGGTTSGEPSLATRSADSHSVDSGAPPPQPQVMDLLTMDLDALPTMQQTSVTGGSTGGSEKDAKEDKDFTSPAAMSASFSSSLGGSRQKLSMWLPGKRKKTTSMSSNHDADVGGEGGGGGGGLLSKFGRSRRSNNKSRPDITEAVASEALGHGHDDAYSTASSSRSEDKHGHQASCLLTSPSGTIGSSGAGAATPSEPTVDEEGFTIRRDDDELPGASMTKEGGWASCSSSDDEEDESSLQQSKLRSITIRPAESAPKMNASVDELRDAIGSLTLQRSSTFDKDPWTASTSNRSPFSQSLGPGAFSLRTPLRPSLTGGDDPHRGKFTDADFSRSNVPLNFSASLTAGGGAMARARPRSISTNQPNILGSTGHLAPSHTGDGRLQRHDLSSSAEWGTASSLADSMTNLSGSTVNLMQATIAEHRVPIALAFNEYLHVWIKAGERTTRVFGTVLVSFAASSFALLTDTTSDVESLSFAVEQEEGPAADGRPKIKTLVPNKQVLSPLETSPNEFAFDRARLAAWLVEQRKERPAAAFFNLEVLRYEVEEGTKATTEPPLLLTSYWKTTMLGGGAEGEEPFSMSNPTGRSHVDLRIDYHINEETSLTAPLMNVQLATRIASPAIVANVVSDPLADWDSSACTLTWRVPEVSRGGVPGGSLKARIYLAEGSEAPPPAHATVQFQANDVTLTGASVRLLATSDTYHVSMTRKKVLAGKYFADPHVRV